jgi:hypothetical protein
MAVTRVEVHNRQPYSGGQSFGEAGPYEQVDGAAFFGVDPAHPDNALIADINLAPPDQAGLVHFSAPFRILRPTSPGGGSRTLFLDVVNRGRGRAFKLINDAPDAADPLDSPAAGNGFLMRQGYTIVWCGWQHDVPDIPGLLGIDVPQASGGDGPASGRMAVTFQPSAAVDVQMLSERGHQPYPTNHLEDWEASLTVRDSEEGEPQPIPRERWHFARLENGRRVPDATHVHLESGFQPGRIYQVIFSSSKTPIAGLGLLGARDFMSFLRYGSAEEGNPCAGGIEYALGFGQSQSGRFLRHLLYLGLNLDEAGRPVFDGVIAHVAGARRGEFNQRFAQPSTANRQSMSNEFPFTDTPQSDPELGATAGLLDRQRAKGGVPKIFLMNSGSEYWWAHLSLIHTDAASGRDVEPSEEVRIYYYAGTQHASGNFPLANGEGSGDARGQQSFNWVDYRPVLRASLVNLDAWVRSDKEPPASRHPRLDDGTLTAPENIAGTFTAIPGVNFPVHLKRHSRLRFDPAASDAENLPATIGNPYPVLAPAVDSDGNELAGIRLPDISTPLATNAGWNLRHPEMGAPGQVIGTTGSTIPFAATREERDMAGDPRPSLEERYASRSEYLARVENAARELIGDGFLLPEDLVTVTGHAAERYDTLTSATRQPQPADN